MIERSYYPLRNKIYLASEVTGFITDVSVNARYDNVPFPDDENLNGLMKYAALPYLWRRMAGVGLWDYEGKKAFASFALNFELISRYDDLLDNNGAILKPVDFKNDEVAKSLLGGVIHSVESSPGSEDLKRSFLRDFASFRRVAYHAYHEYELDPSVDRSFENVKLYKERICGMNARLGARLCRLFSPEISDKVALSAEKTIEAACLYLQVGDDFTDIKTDLLTNTPNYYLAALSEIPDEKRRVIDLLYSERVIKIQDLMSIAPVATAKCEETSCEYRSKVADNFDYLTPFIDFFHSRYFRKIN